MKTALGFLLACQFVTVARSQGAQMIGGRPPAQVVVEQCNIADLFNHITVIQSNPDCRDGCIGGECPPDWYPGEGDQCNAECGRIFEPFWDQCGAMLTGASMGGISVATVLGGAVCSIHTTLPVRS